MVQMSTTQVLKTWSTNLDREARPGDLFGSFTGIMRDKKTLPMGSIVAKVKGKTGATSQTLSLLEDLEGAGRYGNEDQLGFEEDQSTKEFTVYADNLSHAVPGEKYGLKAFEKEPYGVLAMINPQLSLWFSQTKGLYYRSALCEKYSPNLTGANSNVGVTGYVNSNVYVSGVAPGSQPAYSATAATYASNINTSWGSVAELSLDVLTEIDEYATSHKYLEPLSLGGGAMYILTVPTRSATVLKKASNANGSSALFKDSDVRGSGNKAQTLKSFDFGNLSIVEDPKAPRATISAGSIAFSYFGVADNRATAGSTVAEVGFLLGKSPILELELEPLHYETESQNYGKTVGIGGFTTCGTNLREYDIGTPTDTSRYNKSCALVLFKSVA